MAIYGNAPMTPNMGRMNVMAPPPEQIAGTNSRVSPPMSPARTARVGGAMRGSRPANTRGYR